MLDKRPASGLLIRKGASHMNTNQAPSLMNEMIDPEDAREDTLRGMLSGFYSRSMLSVAILVWLWALVFMAVAIFSGIQFFKADAVRDQIMYATIFLTSIHVVALLKIFAWQIIHRNSLKRAIGRLETRIEGLYGRGGNGSP
jgi:hypothetical protein